MPMSHSLTPVTFAMTWMLHIGPGEHSNQILQAGELNKCGVYGVDLPCAYSHMRCSAQSSKMPRG
eukprot:1537494-Amphidinium_carterae.2